MASFWKQVSRCWGWVAILSLWYLYNHALEAVELAYPGHWLGGLLMIFRLFFEPLVLLAVARRALTSQLSPLQQGWEDPLRSALRLYLRGLFIVLVLTVTSVLVYRAAGIDMDLLGEGDLQTRLRHESLRMPLSFLKILWLSALTARGKGLFRSGVRGVKVLFRSRLVVLAGIAWAAVLCIDVLFSPAELLAAGQLARVSWSLFASGIFALVAFLVYSIALREYARIYGGESLPALSQEISQEGVESAVGTTPARTVSLWLVILSFLPIVSVVALILGRRAGRRLRWRSIRAVLAVSCGAFSTAAQVLLLIGLLMTSGRGPGGEDYTFLAQADPGAREEAELLLAGRLDTVAERFKTAEATDLSWGQLAALGIAQTKMGYPELALASFEKASKLGPNRGEFFELYGNLLLSQGRSTEAAAQLRRAAERGLKRQSIENRLALTRGAYKPPKTISIIWSIGILMILFTVHEFAHAWAAFKLGDDTAANAGRLTFNPIAHLDLIGSLLLPGILLWRESSMVFGWAKPVPVDPEKFADPKHDHMLVSFAGPAANLLMGFVAVLLFFASLVLIRAWSPDALSADLANPLSEVSIAGGSLPDFVAPILAFLKQFMVTSLILACFNLLPIPPLDGSWILSGLLPARLQGVLEGVRQYGFIIFMVLIFTSVLDYLLVVPVLFMWLGTMAGCALLGFQ